MVTIFLLPNIEIVQCHAHLVLITFMSFEPIHSVQMKKNFFDDHAKKNAGASQNSTFRWWGI